MRNVTSGGVSTTVIALGMGSEISQSELAVIASRPHDETIILVPNFDNLSSVAEQLRDVVCICDGKHELFLQRVSIACYAERCISYSKSVRLSVRPSATRWHWVKTTQATIMESSLEDSPMTLVSSTLNFTTKFQREHRERGRRMREG